MQGLSCLWREGMLPVWRQTRCDARLYFGERGVWTHIRYFSWPQWQRRLLCGSGWWPGLWDHRRTFAFLNEDRRGPFDQGFWPSQGQAFGQCFRRRQDRQRPFTAGCSIGRHRQGGTGGDHHQLPFKEEIPSFKERWTHPYGWWKYRGFGWDTAGYGHLLERFCERQDASAGLSGFISGQDLRGQWVDLRWAGCLFHKAGRWF